MIKQYTFGLGSQSWHRAPKTPWNFLSDKSNKGAPAIKLLMDKPGREAWGSSPDMIPPSNWSLFFFIKQEVVI